MAFNPASWCSRMFQDCSLPTEEEISHGSWDLWESAGISEPGGCWTRSISECPSDDDGYSVSSLASVLETLDDFLARHPGTTVADWLAYVRRYSLSAIAAAGILRRAARWGETLPEPLRLALEALAASGPTSSAAEE
jgi:hypothetical protein